MKKGFIALEFCCASIVISTLIILSFSVIYYVYILANTHSILEREVSTNINIHSLIIDETGYHLIYSEKLEKELERLEARLNNSLQQLKLSPICIGVAINSNNNIPRLIADKSNGECAIKSRSQIEYSLRLKAKISLPSFISKNLKMIGLPFIINIEKQFKLRDGTSL